MALLQAICTLCGEEEETESLTNRQETINNIGKNLPKFFSCAHEAKSKALVSLLMHDQVSPAQFRSFYTELTGDCRQCKFKNC